MDYNLRHVKATFALVTASLILASGGCGDFDITINVTGTGSSGTGTGGAGGAGGSGGSGGGCVAHFDPDTGAEDDECTNVEEPACEKGVCGGDGLCFKIQFPVGAACGEGKVCDGAGHCHDAPMCDPSPCDDDNECTYDFCSPDSDGACFNSPYPRSHLCGTRASSGHCDPDTLTCCVGVFVQEVAIDSGLPVYHCTTECPAGMMPDSQTAVCM